MNATAASLTRRAATLGILGGGAALLLGCERQEPSDVSVLTPEQFGARAGQDCTDAFVDLFREIDATLKADPGGGVPVATREVRLGEGPYVVRRPFLVPRPGRAQGLTVRGMGKRTSEIVWTGEGPMMTNADRWMGVTWYDMGFRATNDKGVCLLSLSTGGAQDWTFNRVEWRGSWDTGIALDGPATSDTNSEWVFQQCAVKGRYANAWLHSGRSPRHRKQDQFLNFTLRDCKAEPEHGDVLRFSRGGSITVDGGSWILTGERPDGRPSAFFRLESQPDREPSVQHLRVASVRFETRRASSQVIDSAWDGAVTFDTCGDNSQYWRPWAEDQVVHAYTDPGGVRYTNCVFMGRHKYTLTQPPTPATQVVYDQCRRYNAKSEDGFLLRAGPHGADLEPVYAADRDGLR